MFRGKGSIWYFGVLIAVSLATSPSLARSSGPKGDVDPKTRMRFPPRAGAFERKGGIEYDDAGYPEARYYAGALGYSTVFYYKNLPFAVEYANARDAVIQRRAAARLISDGISTLHPGGRRAVFTFEESLDGRKTKMLDELLMFPRGDYYLTFRITYIASHADRMRQEINTFVRGFRMP